ncbi:hypothetical protein ACWFOS_16710 [Gordonia terrae]
MTEPAVIKLDANGDYYFNDAATALLLGINVDTLRTLADDAGCRTPDELPDDVIKSGRRRAKEFAAATGAEDPDVGAALIFYANREGVELIYEDAEGERFPLATPTEPNGGDAPHS